MKPLLYNSCLAAVMLLASPVSGWPSGWPVTNAVPDTYQWNIYTTNLNLRTVVACSLLRSPKDYRLPRPDDMLLLYAKEHGIPISNMVTEARIIAEEGIVMLSSGNISNREEKADLTRYCRKLITFMSHTKDLWLYPNLSTV